MRLRILLTLITMVLLAAAPMQAMQCELSCATMSVHTGMQAEQPTAMSQAHTHCAMHGQSTKPMHTGQRAPGTHSFAGSQLPANHCEKMTDRACHPGCDLGAPTSCFGHSTALVGLPAAVFPADAVLHLSTALAVPVLSNPPAQMHAVPADSAFRQQWSAAVSLSTNFRV